MQMGEMLMLGFETRVTLTSFVLFLVLKKASFCENPFQYSILLWSPTDEPKLHHICLLNDSNRTNQNHNDWTPYSYESIRHFSFGNIISSESTEELYSGRIGSLTTENLITYLNLEKIEQNLPSKSFWETHYDEYLNQRQTLTIKENMALVQLTYTESNGTTEGNYSNIPYTPSASLTKSPQKASKSTNIATYLLIGGIVCLFLQKLTKTTPEGFSSDRRKIILARRKRWLRKIYTLGLIEKSTYQKMLRRLEELPSLVEALGLRDQSKSSSAKGMEKDLKRAKSGESVVKTNEISDVKISR